MTYRSDVEQGAIAAQLIDDLTVAINGVAITDRSAAEIRLKSGLGMAVRKIEEGSNAGGTLILVGNGGSAAMASHGALDFWKNGGVRAVAFNDAVSLTAISNDFSYEDVFARPIQKFANEGDLLLAISSSGASDNILRAVEAGRKASCEVITLSGFDGMNPLRHMGDLNFWVPSNQYGIVETVHDGLIHAIVQELMITNKGR